MKHFTSKIIILFVIGIAIGGVLCWRYGVKPDFYLVVPDTDYLLRENVLLKGDQNSYERLNFSNFKEEGFENREYLLYALYMANKYNYSHADYHVYDILTHLANNNSSHSIDNHTKEIALRYLRKGVAMKDCNACEAMSELYMRGLYVKKDTAYGKELDSLSEVYK